MKLKQLLGTNLINAKSLNELNKLIGEYKTPVLDGMPRFYGGYVGFFVYESAKYAENKINALQRKDSKFDVHMPDIYLVKSEKIIVYDNFNNSIQAIYNANPQQTSYEDAGKSLMRFKTALIIQENSKKLHFQILLVN